MAESKVHCADVEPGTPGVDVQRLSRCCLLLLVAIVWQVWGIVNLARGAEGALAHITAVVAAPILLLFIACGFYMLQPNQAAAITLFGSYRGTDRTTGLRWACRG